MNQHYELGFKKRIVRLHLEEGRFLKGLAVECASMEQKDKILKSYNERNIAVSFDEIFKKRDKAKKLFQNKNIIYAYHNEVDVRGDKPASENEVFNACKEAISDIYGLIKQLIGDVSAAKFFITADHGFLYKRNTLQEFDKVIYPKNKCLYTNKRFQLTEDAVNEQGIMARTMAYLNKIYVHTPVGADIFKVARDGQNLCTWRLVIAGDDGSDH